MADSSDRSLKWYSTREPIILIALTAIAIVFFLAVSVLSRFYQARLASQADKWYRRATYDQKKGAFDRAINEFQAAQLYSRGNFDYQLSMAQTLAALGRTDEAYSYLLNLREQQPDSGNVNLELARIFVKKGDATTAIRYYHNAFYATWPPDAEKQRVTGRFELIDFLLRQNEKMQAHAELIALAANLPQDAELERRAGELFSQSHDYENSLAQYQEALKINGDDEAALEGAGQSAFELARYNQAHQYLQGAADKNPSDSQSANLLKTTELVLQMDPFVRGISVARRHELAIDAFAIAGERLKTCTFATTDGTPSFDTRWKQLKPRITKAGFKQDPDLVDTAMNLVFAIQQAANTQCGEPAEKDRALLLISKLHEAGER